MSADQTAQTGVLLVLVFVCLLGMFYGFKLMFNAGSSKNKEGGGFEPSKIIFIAIFGGAVLLTLSQPGVGQAIADRINGLWGNAITAAQPVVAIFMQIAVIFIVCYVIWLFIRNRWRRR